MPKSRVGKPIIMCVVIFSQIAPPPTVFLRFSRKLAYMINVLRNNGTYFGILPLEYVLAILFKFYVWAFFGTA